MKKTPPPVRPPRDRKGDPDWQRMGGIGHGRPATKKDLIEEVKNFYSSICLPPVAEAKK